MLRPTQWQVNIDQYLNPFLVPPPTSFLPRPLQRLLGRHERSRPHLGNVAISFWAFIGALGALSLISVIDRHVPAFESAGTPLIIGSFGAAAVLEFYAIDSPLSQPRNAILGQLVSSVIGVAMNTAFSQLSGARYQELRWLAGALSCATSIVVMALTGTIHPPAGATALLAVTDDKVSSIGWLLVPMVLLSSGVMFAVAFLVNNIQREFPVYWWTPEEVGSYWARRRRNRAAQVADPEAQGDKSASDDSADLEQWKTSHDEDYRTRPSCLRCLKSGYACKGYDLGLRMQSLVVVTEPEGSQRLARIVPPPTAAAPTLATAGPVAPPLHQFKRGLGRPQDRRGGSDDDADDNAGGGFYKILGGTAHEQQQQARRRFNLSPEMNLTAFQEHMAFSYFFATYGWAYFWKPFLHLARETDLAPTASRMCSLALAYGHMGTGHADKSLKSMGLELYGRSLREVQALLTRGAVAKTELAQLCVPIVILGMYSFAIDRDLRLIHNIGVAQILKHCGPEAFQEDPLLTAFRSCRALLICQSFAIRRRTFLEDKKWKTVPWEKLPKTALDSLIDIMADMPGLVNDMAASEQPISPATRDSFHERVGELRQQLSTWRWKWDRKYPHVAHEVPSNLKVDSIETPVFREQLATMIKFDTTQQAVEMLTYNAALLYLLQLEDLLEMGEPHNPPRLSADDMEYIRHVAARHPSTPLLLPDEAKFICQPALEAFRLIPSLYKNLVTTKDRIMVILAPLGIVYTSTQNNPELNSCMQSILEDIPFFGGGAPKELELYELALGEAWKSKVPSPIPAGTSPTVSESTVELAISP
ncbi:hypothetical protein N8I77_012196 [Diaporthe amygdali]|uniref:HPP transmembrane region domain-containing protein n=1 Tax=Phomopsis amygdali TaxID=1214568 RepID=A0AAD9S5N0_PHOAM|nr:hypothetical protein N8I77_012196 [Diaporthe amygdali]